MVSKRTARAAVVLALGLAVSAQAGQAVVITATGEVEFNQIGAPPLGNVNAGDDVTMTFTVSSTDFVDSVSFPTRGYVIDPASFTLTMGATTIGLQDPFPGGQTPYFVIRDNDPMVDGFFVATSVDFPIGVPIDQPGVIEQFINNYSVTYGGDTLPSLDILDVQGSYDFTGLSVFNWTIDDGPFMPLGIVIEQLTIGTPEVPTMSQWSLLALATGLLAAGAGVMRRRRTA